jgi:hypothetical protein
VTHPTGQLPLAAVASLHNLTALTVANTQLSGPIHSLNFSGLTKLGALALTNNSALGAVMPDLRLCRELQI